MLYRSPGRVRTIDSRQREASQTDAQSLLVKVMQGLLPDEIVYRPKRGFLAPSSACCGTNSSPASKE
ncbi:MAG: hypothetical protein JO333_05270 [Verrucomicrobia bacterium]|nr:hypothetical protein [Verrucomicrobiota bacterium]